jgi:hypothetical protein
MEAAMTTRRPGTALVLGIVLGGLVSPLGAQGAASPPAAAQEAPRSGPLEVTGVYRGYSTKWANLWADDGRKMRFSVDDRAVPDWRKRFKFGERLTITYRDLGSRQFPLAIGMRKAEGDPSKKPAP